jgi:alpha-L-fucosidase
LVARNVINQGVTLSWENAVPEYSYSCFDYYSNYRSTVSYQWNVSLSSSVDEVELIYTEEEAGREILLEVGGMNVPVVLGENSPEELSVESSMADHRFERLRGGVFDGPSSWDSFKPAAFTRSDALVQADVTPFSNYVMTATLDVRTPGYHVLDVTAGNGVEVVVNGETVTKHLNVYKTEQRTEKILLNLPLGQTSVLVRAYNRFSKNLVCGVQLADFQEIYTMKVKLPSRLSAGVKTIRLKADDLDSPHTDCGLHNVRLRL